MKQIVCEDAFWSEDSSTFMKALNISFFDPNIHDNIQRGSGAIVKTAFHLSIFSSVSIVSFRFRL